MSELPKGWQIVRLEEVCEINPRERGPLDPAQSISFIPMTAVSDRSGEILEHETRPFEQVSKGYTRFRENDVIFAKITPCMENGKIAVAKGLHNRIACGSTEFHVLRSRGSVLPEYIWRFLRQEAFREDAEHHMAGAVGQRRVPAQYLKDALIPMPPLDEQRRIVATLDRLFARSKHARVELKRVPQLVERMKQSVLAAAFRGELNPDVDLVEFEPKAFDTFIESTFYGPRFAKTAYITDGVPTLRTTDFSSSGDVILNFPPTVQVTKSDMEKWGLLDGDILVTRTGSIGKCALYTEDLGPALPSAYLIRVRLDKELIDPRYCLLFLLSKEGQDQLGAGITAVTQPNINAGVIRGLLLPVPSVSTQTEIVRHIEAAFTRIDHMAAEAARATALLDRLDQATLAKAFRGELVSGSAKVSDTVDEYVVRAVEPIDDQVQLSLLLNESTD